mmetsp:Transcript_11389/g.32339  ORF Transcript_11389/g.32339 Transcript_11389/m.32339 type:complete len:313 (+) Transcript_11389:278-1216(+)
MGQLGSSDYMCDTSSHPSDMYCRMVVARRLRDGQQPVQDAPGLLHLQSDRWHGEVNALSESRPRAFLYKNFLTPEECDHLVQLALPDLQTSMVEDPETGEETVSKDRTSRNAFLLLEQDEVVARIEKRISSVTHIPSSHGERLQVLEYLNGQQFNAHYDYIDNPANCARVDGGQRLATFLMYLSTVPDSGGGETCFPKAMGKVWGKPWSTCAQGSKAVKPRKGDALLFFNVNLDNSKDTSALHKACPTTEGIKYTAVKYLKMYPAGGGCFDAHVVCKSWALKGDCEASPSYMLKECKKSCQACEDGTIPVGY